ncbi:MAG: glycosyltransferase family 39 protein [Bacteroidales bacterium]|nr:glycosyltransferase family 39 protein [Bacteroidales bacterium]
MKKNKLPRKKDKTFVEKGQSNFFSENKYLILLGAVLLIVGIIRLRLMNIPLERDEGEYAYFGQLMLNGIPPFEAAYTMKFPGTSFMYALFILLFGQSAAGVHIGILILNVITSVFLFFIAARMIGNAGALVTALVFSLLSVSDSVLGFAGHATHFVVFAGITGIFLVLHGIENRKWKYFLFSGIFFGLVPVFKQSGLFYSVIGVAVIILHFLAGDRKNFTMMLKNLAVFIAGGLIPALLIILLMMFWSVFDTFLFWTIEYPFAYGGQVPLERGISNFKDNFSYIVDGNLALWVLAASGIPLLFFNRRIRKHIFTLLFLLLFLVLTFMTTVPGLYFRPHYFISWLPAVAFFAGIAIDTIGRFKHKNQKSLPFQIFSLIILIVAVGMGIGKNFDYLFKEDPKAISRRVYGLNPFVESEAIGEFIQRNTAEDDKIAVLGSEPQIYFYANRVSATGFIYMYPMMEDHAFNLSMQKQMIAEMEEADPAMIVIVDINKSWLRKANSPLNIFGWSSGISSAKDYEMIGSVELYSNTTLYKFTPVALENQPVSQYRIRLFRKKA